MLVSRRRIGPFAHEVWVYEDVVASPLDLREYRNTTARRRGYKVIPAPTAVIDLATPPAEILAQFNATTRSEVRKAMKLGVVAHASTLDDLIPFYEQFAKQKRLEPISKQSFSWTLGNWRVTAAKLNGETLGMHSYFIEPTKQIVRLFHSASHFRGREDVSIISAAKRYLHYADMLTFQAEGFKFFDLGGMNDGPIGQYKRGFGGRIVEQAHLQSWPLALLLAIRRALHLRPFGGEGRS